MARAFDTVEAVYFLLTEHSTSSRLVRHAQFVVEAARQLTGQLTELAVGIDEHFVLIGAALHDAGKIKHPEELLQPGHLHEDAGEKFLLELGIDPKLARVCLSHNQWKTLDCSLEELTIALADNLWKGKRNDELEQLFLERVYFLFPQRRWDIFLELDTCFEAIASGGDSRLLRS